MPALLEGQRTRNVLNGPHLERGFKSANSPLAAKNHLQGVAKTIPRNMVPREADLGTDGVCPALFDLAYGGKWVARAGSRCHPSPVIAYLVHNKQTSRES
jgi:hypothetical protein